jgi:hypothetical protein
MGWSGADSDRRADQELPINGGTAGPQPASFSQIRYIDRYGTVAGRSPRRELPGDDDYTVLDHTEESCPWYSAAV